ncbi:MAG: DnaJ domain-containing protein [Alphaproteobacteria bacterium]|nr:DnaJ domain-containing protein [Alphaproteobacteria bacterium]
MIDLLIGAFALVLILVLLHGFTRADPKALVRGLRYLSAGVLVLAGAFFFVRGIVPAAVLLGSMAYGVLTGGRVWPGGRPYWNFPRPGGGGPRTHSGQSTRVATDWLEMELDHDTGDMRGRVLKGAFAGQPLDQLSEEDALRVYGEAGAADSETARLLEAYLDLRLGAEWRTKTSERASSSRPRSRDSSGMTREEASRVLGLSASATEEEIRAAHRRLMLNLHPDRGGTDYLAAKINEAKDVLLG